MKFIHLKMRLIGLLLSIIIAVNACKVQKDTVVNETNHVISTNEHLTGRTLEIVFRKGSEHNHPLMAVWAEDLEGNFLQTLYVAESIGKGIFKHGDASSGKWEPGPVRRPAALPVWAHRRGIKAEDGLYIPSTTNPVIDAVTGATPPGDFVLNTRLNENVPHEIVIYFEINQPWDFNKHWTNNKYPGNEEYKTSCQPALVYAAKIHLNDPGKQYTLELVGHGHFAGENGNLYEDVSTFSTALGITKDVLVKVKD
jgi:hypothetical protein